MTRLNNVRFAHGARRCACALWLCAVGSAAFAQDHPQVEPLFLEPPAPLDTGAETSREITEQPPRQTLPPAQEPVSKRLFGVLPNYRADQAKPIYTPLTTAEKFKIARNDSFDWPNYFLLAGYAIQAQVASGGFSHNGGLKGFGEFYARGMADQVIGNYVTEAILPTLLHEDPRYFRLGSGGFQHRATYAVTRVLITRTDNGGKQFNIAEVAGNAGVVAVTSLYYPESQSASEGLERFSVALGNDMISNLLTEFWPDIRNRLRFRGHYLFPH